MLKLTKQYIKIGIFHYYYYYYHFFFYIFIEIIMVRCRRGVLPRPCHYCSVGLLHFTIRGDGFLCSFLSRVVDYVGLCCKKQLL